MDEQDIYYVSDEEDWEEFLKRIREEAQKNMEEKDEK